MSLEECIQTAIDNNLSVKRSELAYTAAQINLSESKANRYPSLNFGANYGTNWGRSIDPTTNRFISRQINTSGITGSAGMLIFGGGQVHYSIKQSQLNIEASQFDVEKSKNDISLDIATFYLNVIFNKELVENANFQLESSNQQLSRTKRLVELGSLPRTSELELVSQVASNEVTVVNAQNNLALARLNLKQAMLLPSSQNIEIIVPNLELDSTWLIVASAEDIFQTALTNQPEIKSAKKQIESANYGVKVSTGAYYPTLSINGGLFTNYSSAADMSRTIYDNDNPILNEVPIGYYYQNPTTIATVYTAIETGTPIGDEQFGWGKQWNENFSQSFSLNLSIPVFNKLRTKSSVQRSKIQLQQMEIAVVEEQNFLRQTIESAYNDASAAQKTYFASTKQVDALEETFRAMENQYNLGVANFTDYQVASNNLFRAKSDLVRSKYDYIFRKKILEFYQNLPLTFEQ
jgi:outer membrane protein